MLVRVATQDTSETRRDRARDIAEHVELSRMSEADDVEAYLTTFERVMQLGRVSEELWTLKLVKQLVNTMPMKIHVWVAKRKPQTGAEVGWLADEYLQACCHIRQGIQGTAEERSTGGAGEPRKYHHCGSEDHLKWDCPIKQGSREVGNSHKSAMGKSGNSVKC